MKKCVLLIVLGMIACFGYGTALAGGGQAYPGGPEAFMVGVAPPPGFTFINYMYYYRADALKDSDGNDVPVFDHVSVKADIMRFIWFSQKQLLGADYGQHFFLFFADSNLDFKVPVGPEGKRHYSDTGIPFFIYSPFLLGWHTLGGKLHFVLDIADIYVPLYNEDRGNLASLGRNFWTIEPVFAFTWLPAQKWEVSAKFMYDFNTKQKNYPLPTGHEVDRVPGQEFHFDYNVSYAIFDNFRIGANGFYYRQVRDDDFDLDGFSGPERAILEEIEGQRSTVWSIGPGIFYQLNNIFLTLRSQFEMDAENKSEGYNVWFKFIYVF